MVLFVFTIVLLLRHHPSYQIATGDRHIYALYIVNDVAQRWKRGKSSSACEALVTAFGSVLSDVFTRIHNGKDMTEEKKAKLDKLSTVWVKQGLFGENALAVQKILGVAPIEGTGLSSPSLDTTALASSTRKVATSGPGTPSKPATNESGQVEDGLRSLLPTPASDTWLDTTDLPPRFKQLFVVWAQVKQTQVETKLAKERATAAYDSLTLDYDSAKKLSTVEEVMFKGWDLDRDVKIAKEYEDKLAGLDEVYRRLGSAINRCLDDIDEWRERVVDDTRAASRNLERYDTAKKFLMHRQDVITGAAPDAPPAQLILAASKSKSNTASSPAPSANKGGNKNSSSSADSRPPRGGGGDRRHSPERRDSRGGGGGGQNQRARSGSQGDRHDRGGRPDERRDGRNDHKDHKDARKDQKDARNDHRDTHAPKEGKTDERERRDGSAARDGPTSPDRQRNDRRAEDQGRGRGGRDGGKAQGGGGAQQNQRGAQAKQAGTQDKATPKKAGNAASNGGKKESNASRMAVDEKKAPKTPETNALTASTSSTPGAPASKRRNREDAGLQVTTSEAAGTKKAKRTEEEEATAFYEE